MTKNNTASGSFSLVFPIRPQDREQHCIRFLVFPIRSEDREQHKLQALVYDILPSTTAVFSYAIQSWKLSANKQFFVGVQTVVSLLQTTQIKQGVSFIAANSLHQHK